MISIITNRIELQTHFRGSELFFFVLLFFFYAIASASSDLMYAMRNEDNMERCDIFTSSPCVFLPSLAQDLEERRTFVMQCFFVRVYVCFCQGDLAVEKEKGHIC